MTYRDMSNLDADVMQAVQEAFDIVEFSQLRCWRDAVRGVVSSVATGGAVLSLQPHNVAAVVAGQGYGRWLVHDEAERVVV
jgi:hypothetical protein